MQYEFQLNILRVSVGAGDEGFSVPRNINLLGFVDKFQAASAREVLTLSTNLMWFFGNLIYPPVRFDQKISFFRTFLRSCVILAGSAARSRFSFIIFQYITNVFKSE